MADLQQAPEAESRGALGTDGAVTGSRGVRARWRSIPESFRATIPLLVAIIALGAYTASRSAVFLTWANVEIILQQISVLGLISVGMTMLMIAGLIDLSVGALASFISVIGAKMAVGGAGSFEILLVALAVGMVASLAFGLIVGTVKVEPFILTLGGMSIFTSLGLALSKGQPIAIDGGQFLSLGVGNWLGLPASGVLFIGAVVAAALVLRFTRMGRNAYAMGSNPQAAFLSGVGIRSVTLQLFGLSGLLVGVAAVVMMGRLGAGDPTAGGPIGLQAVAAVVLGGASLTGGSGTLWGTFLGVVLLGMIQNSLNLLGIQLFYQDLVYGSVLIIAVVGTTLREQGRLRIPRLRRGEPA